MEVPYQVKSSNTLLFNIYKAPKSINTSAQRRIRDTRRCIFSFRLKISIDADDWISIGSLFHLNGAAVLNALSPQESNFEVCVLSR